MKLKTLAMATLALASTSVFATNQVIDAKQQYFKPFSVTDGYPVAAERDDILYNLGVARASELFIWAQPLNTTYSMRGAGLHFGDYLDITFFSDFSDHLDESTTVNNESLYAYSQIDLSKGPVVYEQPAMDKNGYLFGSVVNVWEVAQTDLGVPKAAPDNGKGGKYLILPPGYEGDIPAGYHVVQSDTNFVYLGMRSVMTGDGNKNTAIARIKKMKVYPLANPAAQGKFIDVAGKRYPAENKTDIQVFEYMHEWLNTENVEPVNAYMAGLLKHLGIEKGKPFPTDKKTLDILEQGAKVGLMGAKELSPTGFELSEAFPGTQWRPVGQAETWAPDFITPDGILQADRRIAYFHLGCMPPKNMGTSTYYVVNSRDKQGNDFSGSKLYKLHLDANIPIASGFWSAIAYDKEKSRMIENSHDKYAISSLAKDLEYNEDGSIDIYFGGTEVPEGVSKSNWVPSSGRDFWVAMRFYGPDWSRLGKTWTMNDFEVVK